MKMLYRMRKGESGFSLIEMMVVIVIISIVGFIGFKITMMFLGGYMQSLNAFYMRQEKSDVHAYLYQHNYRVSTAELAPNPDNPETVKSVAMAGDQAVWCHDRVGTNTRWCVRMFYVARWRRVFEARAPEPYFYIIDPVRGPNETVPARADCPAPCYIAAPGSPLSDHVLDTLFRQQGGGANQLSSNVSLSAANITSPTVTAANAPFKYFTSSRAALGFWTPQASSSAAPLTLAQRARVGEIQFSFYIQPPITAPWGSISPVLFDYWFQVTP